MTAKELVVGDVADSELSAGEGGHLGVEALVVGDAMVGGDLGFVLFDGEGEQTRQSGIVLNDGAKEDDLSRLWLHGGNGAREPFEGSNARR